jgi:hypothetical protein
VFCTKTDDSRRPRNPKLKSHVEKNTKPGRSGLNQAGRQATVRTEWRDIVEGVKEEQVLSLSVFAQRQDKPY